MEFFLSYFASFLSIIPVVFGTGNVQITSTGDCPASGLGFAFTTQVRPSISVKRKVRTQLLPTCLPYQPSHAGVGWITADLFCVCAVQVRLSARMASRYLMVICPRMVRGCCSRSRLHIQQPSYLSSGASKYGLCRSVADEAFRQT